MKEKARIMLLVKTIKDLENSQGFISASDTKGREEAQKYYNIIGRAIFNSYRGDVSEFFNPKNK